jgi:5-methylthioadenosine/S-adenosylhomocysteine deaminase
VVPVAGPPIRDGAVLVDAAGRIAAVGPDALVPSPPQAAREHLAGVALLPGLINTHTHLELTGFAGQAEEGEFWAWIKRIIAIKAARSEEAFFDAACAGIRDQWSAGVTTVCDTGSTGAVIAALDHLGASGFAHHEVFGMHPEQADAAMRAFTADLGRLARHATGRVGLGVSPHAPYTVSGPLYRAAADVARAHGVPMAVHVAEPPAESALLRDFTGVFAEMWTEHGVPRPTELPVTPVGWLERHGVLSERTLCVHVIDTTADDVALMQRHHCAVAHCPRSNRRHHAADAPVRRYLEAGLRVGLGTDSEVSVDPPDLIAEARAAQALTGWTAAEAVRALTLGGAEALGLAHATGTLAAGKLADLVAVHVGATDAPEAAVLAAGRGGVVGTWLGGRPVHRVTCR